MSFSNWVASRVSQNIRFIFSPAGIVIFLTINTLEVVSKLLATNGLQLPEGRDFENEINLKNRWFFYF